MRATFKYYLDDQEAELIAQFCKTSEYCAIEQQLGFPEILYNTRINYFYLIDDLGVIRSFCQVNENFRFAHVWYGPVCEDRDLMIESVKNIAEYYKRRKFWYLGIQPYRKTGFDADYIEYKLNSILKIDYLFNNENTKASLEIDLNKDIEEIFRTFSKGHKSAVKKAQTIGITVSERTTDTELGLFIESYLKMCSARKIKSHSVHELESICRYLEKYKIGTLLLVKDADHKILGGSLFAYQGLSVRYLLSASDPDRRDMPVAHLAIYKAIENAKRNNFKYFDLWGYNHFAVQDDQAYLVNRFKKGFGGTFTFLMKKMNISLVPNGFLLYVTYNYLKRKTAILKNLLSGKN